MGEFFKPWPRKIGVVALLMASPFLGGLVRSRSTEDVVVIRYNGSINAFKSTREGIVWQLIWDERGKYSPLPFRIKWNSFPVEEDTAYHPDQANSGPTRWERLGFRLETTSAPNQRRVMIGLPYWSIVVPLTLLAAYLAD